MKSAVEHIQIPVRLIEGEEETNDFSINLKTLSKVATKMKILAELNELETNYNHRS